MDTTLKIAVIGAIALIIAALIKLLGDLIRKGSSGGSILTVIIIVLLLLGGGAFILFSPTLLTSAENVSSVTDKIAGTWIGATTWNNYQGLKTTVFIKAGCAVGDVCGTTRTDGTYWCAGDLVLSSLDGDTFHFTQQNEHGNAPEGCPDGAIETLHLLTPGNISWSVTRSTGNNPGAGSGDLIQQ